MNTVQADFDRIAQFDHPRWDHNSHYHSFLLRALPPWLGDALDIGCGHGDFARLLAARAEHVLAVDLSPEMIRQAKAKSVEYHNVDFQVADVTQWHWPVNRFDCIASIATLHHIPLEDTLRHIKAALRPGGRLLVLDLYQQLGMTWRDLIAAPVSAALKLIKNGTVQDSPEVRAAWEAHGQHDQYLPLAQVRAICAELLPGAVVTQHLLWRCSIVWEKKQ